MTTALILAGGLGTRLRQVVGDVPKPLADVAGKPFLCWLLGYLAVNGFKKVYLSAGYKADLIQAAPGHDFAGLSLTYIVETQQLGTGGAIRYALETISEEEIVVLNGDTLAILDFQNFITRARECKADVTLALAKVEDVGRYGAVEVCPDGRIKAFSEKGRSGEGLINAGVYVLRRSIFDDHTLPQSFSFESDFLHKKPESAQASGVVCVTEFIDIGVPEDYALAQTRIPQLLTSPEMTQSNFYDLSFTERKKRTLEAIDERRTLVSRWETLATEITDSWAIRAQRAAAFLGDIQSVADVGCGMMLLERYLDDNIRYVPLDVVRRDDRTIVVDLNKETLPSDLGVDYIAGLGLLEYLFDVPRLLQQVANHYEGAVFSYNAIDHFTDVEERTGHAWVNHYSVDQLDELFLSSGFLIEERVQCDATQTMWRLRSIARA